MTRFNNYDYYRGGADAASPTPSLTSSTASSASTLATPTSSTSTIKTTPTTSSSSTTAANASAKKKKLLILIIVIIVVLIVIFIAGVIILALYFYNKNKNSSGGGNGGGGPSNKNNPTDIGGNGFPAGTFTLTSGSNNLQLNAAASPTLSLASPNANNKYQQWQYDGCQLWNMGNNQIVTAYGSELTSNNYVTGWTLDTSKGTITSNTGPIVCLANKSGTLVNSCSSGNTGWLVTAIPEVTAPSYAIGGNGFPTGVFSITNGGYYLVNGSYDGSGSGRSSVVLSTTNDTASNPNYQWYVNGCLLSSMYDNNIFSSDGTNFYCAYASLTWQLSSGQISSITSNNPTCIGVDGSNLTSSCSNSPNWTATKT